MKLTQLAGVGFACMLFLIGNQAYALTASPVKVEVQGDPGQTLHGEIELINEQSELKTLFTSFENFEPAGDTGSPRFIGNESGLATWMGSLASLTIEPTKKVVVPYTIAIPKDAEPGGYFAAIFFGEQDPQTQEAGEVSIGGKLGILILLRVSGNIVEDAGLSEYKTSNGTRVFSSLPILFSYRFSNKGGDRVVPLGDIVIKNTFGGTATTLSANKNEGSVLPNSSRKFESIWGQSQSATSSVGFLNKAKQQLSDFHFGLYSAHISVTYGATNQVANDVYRFMLIPWQLLCLCALVLVVLYFALRRYNAWIISKNKSNT